MLSTYVACVCANAFCFATCILWNRQNSMIPILHTTFVSNFSVTAAMRYSGMANCPHWIWKKAVFGQKFCLPFGPPYPIFLLRFATGFYGFSTLWLRVRKSRFFSENQGFMVIHGFSTAYYGYSTGFHHMITFSMILDKTCSKMSINLLMERFLFQ